MHEWVELIKAIAWPFVVLYFLVRFHSQIGLLLREMPDAVRRVRSAHGLGVDIRLDRLGDELTLADSEARQLSLNMPVEPKPKKLEGGEKDA
jgi:hypothetical protein